MRREFISKIVLGVMISTTLFTLVPVRASAEWVTDYQNNWYYTVDNQKMTGWKRIDGQLYYFDNNGKMQTGWINARDSWYFLQNNGILKTGWFNYNKNWYYADSIGSIQTGTINIEGKVYVFDSNGVMKTNNTVINGQFYTIGSNGEVAGMKVPTPDKEFDGSGNCIAVLKNTDNSKITSPTDPKFTEVVEDKSISNAPEVVLKYSVKYKDSDGTELKEKTVSSGKSIELYEPSKTGYIFTDWNTKSDGLGKSYKDGDDVKIKDDLTLYAQWNKDTSTSITSITVKGNSSIQVGKTAQMTAEILPEDAGLDGVTWEVINGTGQATINSDGLLTGVANGTITVKATAKGGSSTSGSKQVTVGETNVAVPVTSIAVTSKTGATTITANGGTLQMKAEVSPDDADDQSVVWSVEKRTGSAEISATGLLKAISNGTVTVKATDSSGKVAGSATILISGQITKIPVTDITLTPTSGVINTDDGTLKMLATVAPTSATNKDVTWTIVSGKEHATISTTGVLKAISNGTVTVKATANDGSGISSIESTITISGQSLQATGILVEGEGGFKTITTDGGSLKMLATMVPDGANDSGKVTWTVQQVGDMGSAMTGRASIDADGILTAEANGIVTVKATSIDNTKITGSKAIEIKGQIVPLTGLSISGTNSINEIKSDKGRLQMVATLVPTYTTEKNVTWAIVGGKNSNGQDIDGTTLATIDGATGLLKAISKDGTVTVQATSTGTENLVATQDIKISGQIVNVNGITVNGPQVTSGSAATISEITIDDGTLQMSAEITPADASNKGVTWSVEQATDSGGTEATDKATITQSGLLKAIFDGEVIVKATAKDGSGIVGRKTITLSGQLTKVTKITINGPSEVEIGSPIDFTAYIEPGNASNKAIDWTIIGGTGTAIINEIGSLTATSVGTITVKATAKDGSGVFATRSITIKPTKTP